MLSLPVERKKKELIKKCEFSLLDEESLWKKIQ